MSLTDFLFGDGFFAECRRKISLDCRESLGRTFERIIDKVATNVGVAYNAFFVAEDVVALFEQCRMLASCAAALELGAFSFFLHGPTSDDF